MSETEKTFGKKEKKLIASILFTMAGFLVAILENLLVPQFAIGVDLEVYDLKIFGLNHNEAFRLLLICLMAAYGLSGIFSFKSKKKAEEFIQKARFRFAMGIALGIWDYLGTKIKVLPQPFFPGPAEILTAFLSEGNYIFHNTLYSLRLYAGGFVGGVFLGVLTGILIGWFPKVKYWVEPVLKITGVIPAVAWMPFALTLFPTPYSAAVFLIVICAWFPIASLTRQGIESTPKSLFEASEILGSSTVYQVFHVAVPYAMPQIFTGISTANGFAFTTLVMAEMMGQPGGLGYYINASKVWSAYYKVFAAILVMAVLFSFITGLLNIVQRRVLRWQRGLIK